MISCSQKEDVVTPKAKENTEIIIPDKVTSIHERLKIDRAYYESLLGDENNFASLNNQLEKSKGFVSFHQFKQNASARLSGTQRLANVDTSDYPEFLQKLLNPDGIVQIGDYLIRINVSKNTAFVLYSKDSTYYKNLVQENTKNAPIYTFPLQEEVLYKMDSVSTVAVATSARTDFWRPITCRNRWANQKTTWITQVNAGINGGLQYRATGIYFDLVMLTTLSANIQKGVYNLNIEGFGRRRCANEVYKRESVDILYNY